MIPCVESVQVHLPYGLAFCGSVYFATLLFLEWKKKKRQ